MTYEQAQTVKALAAARLVGGIKGLLQMRGLLDLDGTYVADEVASLMARYAEETEEADRFFEAFVAEPITF